MLRRIVPAVPAAPPTNSGMVAYLRARALLRRAGRLARAAIRSTRLEVARSPEYKTGLPMCFHVCSFPFVGLNAWTSGMGRAEVLPVWKPTHVLGAGV